MLYSSPFFQALTALFAMEMTSAPPVPCGMYKREHVLPVLSALHRGVFGGFLEQGDLAFGWSIHVLLL